MAARKGIGNLHQCTSSSPIAFAWIAYNKAPPNAAAATLRCSGAHCSHHNLGQSQTTTTVTNVQPTTAGTHAKHGAKAGYGPQPGRAGETRERDARRLASSLLILSPLTARPVQPAKWFLTRAESPAPASISGATDIRSASHYAPNAKKSQKCSKSVVRLGVGSSWLGGVPMRPR